MRQVTVPCVASFSSSSCSTLPPQRRGSPTRLPSAPTDARRHGTLAAPHRLLEGGNTVSRLSPFRRHEIAPTVERKDHRIKELTRKIGDSNRTQSESRKCRVYAAIESSRPPSACLPETLEWTPKVRQVKRGQFLERRGADEATEGSLHGDQAKSGGACSGW